MSKTIRTTNEDIVQAPECVEAFIKELNNLCCKYSISIKTNNEGGLIFGDIDDFKDITIDNCYIKNSLLK